MEKFYTRKVFFWVGGVLASLVLVVALLVLWLYTGAASGTRLRVFTWLGAPLGVVGSEYIKPAEASYFVNPSSGSDVAGLVANLQLESVAAQRGIRVSKADIETAAAQLASHDTDYQNFEAQYGKLAAFKVLATPYVYKNYLRMDYMRQGFEPALTQQLQSLSSRLRSDSDWEALAGAESEDLATSWSAGDAGYVDLSFAIPEYAEAVRGLPLRSPAVIYTRFGAHVVEVLNRVSTQGKELVRLREIVLRPKRFDTWLAGQTAAVPVKWYVQLPQ